MDCSSWHSVMEIDMGFFQILLKSFSGSLFYLLRFPDYCSDEGSPTRKGNPDMSVFKEAVLDCLDYKPNPVEKTSKLNRTKPSNEDGVERFSGLRIRYIFVLFFLVSLRNRNYRTLFD